MRVDNFFSLSIASLVVTSSFKSPCQLKQLVVRKEVFSDMFNWGAAQIKFADGDFNDAAPTWATLDAKLRDLETVEEREFADNFSFGRGRSNHKANIRLFDAPEGFEPDLVLYRDTAGWCPYCEKVWLQLEEKKIPYRVEKVPMRCYGQKPASFMRINPSGGIPVANIRGRILTESNDIMYLIESEYPLHKPLLPPSGSPLSSKVTPLLRLERRVFGSWFQWLTSDVGKAAEDEMDRLLVEVDAALEAQGGPYFLGDDISLVDVMFTPFLERMAASLPYYKGFVVRGPRYPHLLRWYEAMDQREAYIGIKSDYYTHCHDLPPQIGRCCFTKVAKPFKDEIDGGAWDVSRNSADLLEPMIPSDGAEACRDAARQVLANAPNLVRFAIRAVGTKGSPGVSAPLADPNAVPNEKFTAPVDAAMRLVVDSLLRAAEGASAPPEGEVAVAGAAPWPKDEVAKSLLYVRDRVGVPRDVSVHGARQLRAHINLVLAQLAAI